MKGQKAQDTERPYSSPAQRSHERGSRSRDKDSVLERASTPTLRNSHGNTIATDKQMSKQSDVTTDNDNEPGSRSSQGHKFRNKILPLYGDIDSLMPRHLYPDQPFNVTQSQGGTSEVSDNLANEAKNATETHNVDQYTASINSDYILLKHEGKDFHYEHNPSQSDEVMDFTTSNKLEREYSTISDFSSITDTAPLVKSDMKRSLTAADETELRPSDSKTQGFENPMFSYSCSVDSTCTDTVLEPTPVKRYRSDTGNAHLPINHQ